MIDTDLTQQNDSSALSPFNENNGTSFDTDTEGYSVIGSVILVILFVVIILVIVVGNCIVILSVYCENSLRCVTNYYIVSLSMADLLLGIIVLPFSATYQVLGYWIFGPQLCFFWTAFDVLVCTASICNLVVISLDRFV